MGYLFLLIAAFLNLTKSYCSKRISGRVDTLAETVDMTLVRNFLCAVIGALLILLTQKGDFSLPAAGWGICLVAGVAIGVNYIVWVLALKSGVYLFASAANSAGFIVAVLCGLLFFEEQLTLLKGLAIVLILVAMLFMGRYQKDTGGKTKPVHLLLLFLVFLSGGISSVTQKWFTRTLPEVSAHSYTFYSLAISVALLLIFTFFLPKRPPAQARVKSVKGLLPWIAVMAGCFYGVTYFQTGASAMLDAVVMYPVYNGALLAAGSIMAWVCFSEKPNRNSIIGVLLVFAAVVLAGL